MKEQEQEFLNMVKGLAELRFDQSQESCENKLKFLGVTVTIHTNAGDCFQKFDIDNTASFSLITNFRGSRAEANQV